MIILLVCVIVDKWCVMISVVWFLFNIFNVFWIMDLFFKLSVFVVLFKIRIGGLFKNILVIDNFCFWLFDNLIFCLFILVLYFCGKFIIKLCVLVIFVVLIIFLFVVVGWLSKIFFLIVLENKILFCCINFIWFFKFFVKKFLMLWLFIKICLEVIL